MANNLAPGLPSEFQSPFSPTSQLPPQPLALGPAPVFTPSIPLIAPVTVQQASPAPLAIMKVPPPNPSVAGAMNRPTAQTLSIQSPTPPMGATNSQTAQTSSAPANSAPTMSAATQQSTFGFTAPALPPYGLESDLDAVLNQVKTGISPYDFRPLDLWTGAVHFQYQLPDGTIPKLDYIWTLKTDGSWVFLDANGNPNGWKYAPAHPDVTAYNAGNLIQARPSASGTLSAPPSTVSAALASTTQNPIAQSPQAAAAAGVPANNNGGKSTVLNQTPQSGNSGQNSPTQTPGATSGQSTSTGVPPTTQATGSQSAGQQTVDQQIIGAANGANPTYAHDAVSVLLTWDQWNYYYNLVTGNHGPAPESVGIKRNSAGLAVFPGPAQATTADYLVWKGNAFPQATVPANTAGSGASGSGGGTQTTSGGASSVSSAPGGPSPYPSTLAELLAALIGGETGVQAAKAAGQ